MRNLPKACFALALALLLCCCQAIAIDCGPVLALIAPLEKIALKDSAEVLNSHWTSEAIIKHNLQTFSNAPAEGVTEIAGENIASSGDLAKLATEWRKLYKSAKDTESPGFYERMDSLQATESRMFVSYLRNSGISVVANLMEGKNGGRYNDTVLSLAGDSPANRLARVVYYRTGLLIELSELPRLQVDETSGRIRIPKSSFLTNEGFAQSLGAIHTFVDRQTGSARVTRTQSGRWIDSEGKKVDFHKIVRKLEVNFGLDGAVDTIDFRSSKIPLVGTVPQNTSDLASFAIRFGKRSSEVLPGIAKNIDITLDKFGAAAQPTDYHVSLLIVNPATGKVGNFRTFTGTIEERISELKKADAMISEIVAKRNLQEGGSPQKVTVIALQSSTTATPIDPLSVSTMRTFLRDWRQHSELSLSRLSPTDMDVQLVNAWVDPDHATPVIFHRPLNIYSEGSSVTTLAP